MYKQSLYDDIVEIFKVFDKDNTKYITKNEIMINTEDLINNEDIESFWEAADIEAEGQVNYMDFLARILKKWSFYHCPTTLFLTN